MRRMGNMKVKVKKMGQSSPLVLALLVGCASPPPAAHPVMERASRDLSCDESQLTRKTIDETTILVHGCGKRVTYVKECSPRFNAAASATVGMPTSRDDCSWVPQSEAGK